MAAYPGAIASFAGFTSTHTLAADNHAAQHNLEQGEIVAVQTKVGTGASTPAVNQVLKGGAGGSSSWGQVILSSDVTGVLPVANGGTAGNTAADARASLSLYSSAEVDSAIATAVATTKQALYPVGSIYTNATNSTNPATLLGFGTWSSFGEGRVMVGLNSADTDFDTAEETGGSKTISLAHTHGGVTGQMQNLVAGVAMTSGAVNINHDHSITSSGSVTQTIVQPYIVVYMWKRTA